MLQNSTCTWWCHERGMGTSSPYVISVSWNLLPNKIAPALNGLDMGMGTSSPSVIGTKWELLPTKIAPALCDQDRGMGTPSPSIISSRWYLLPTKIAPAFGGHHRCVDTLLTLHHYCQVDPPHQNSTCTWWSRQEHGHLLPSIISSKWDLLPAKIAPALCGHEEAWAPRPLHH